MVSRDMQVLLDELTFPEGPLFYGPPKAGLAGHAELLAEGCLAVRLTLRVSLAEAALLLAGAPLLAAMEVLLDHAEDVVCQVDHTVRRCHVPGVRPG